jgi:pyruvate kinase
MSKTLISGETLKTIGQGALGAMTFGAYHQFTTNKLMELNNEKIEIQHKYFMDKMENKYKINMDKYKLEMEKMEIQNKRLNEKIEKLEKKSWW